MKKKMDNKGFSLVELIIVIAIMAVLVGILAPQFIRYVEQSRRSTDIQNAENIRTAVLADIADGKTTGTGSALFNGTALSATTIVNSEIPTIEGNRSDVSDTYFTVNWNANDGTCVVYAGTYPLTTVNGADSYKNEP